MPLSPAILTRLQYQQQTIFSLIGDLNETQLKKRVNPEKWSTFENIAHLAAYQPVFIRRMERISCEQSPLFERYVAEKDPLFPAYLEKSLEELIADIQDKRTLILDRLTGLNDAELERMGRHPKYGLFSTSLWAEFFLLHESHHLYTIFILVQEIRAGL
ncbi:DinB family protein [Flavitalea flava]